jgi:hypothetical protein
MPSLDRILTALGFPARKAPILVVVQTERGQVVVPADSLKRS